MPSNSDVYPYGTIAFITDTIGGESWQASGVLIAPDEVLTASHVVYSSTYGVASNIKVSLGYDDGTVAIGSTSGIAVDYNKIQDYNDFITTQQSQYDYAVIKLATPFTGVGTMGLEPDFQGGSVDISGYPGVAGGQLVTSQQTVALEPNFSVFNGTSIGAGSSGGPVWVTGSNGQAEVVGLVSSGTGGPGSEGFFSQISTAAYDQIEGWLAQDGGTPVAAAVPLAVLDTTTGQTDTPVTTAYTGPVQGVQNQFIDVTTDSLNVAATSPSWFIHTGSGEDAIAVTSGTNVLDGGTGSNFMTGGGGTDTFFADDRNATASIWDTINNFHVGDAATIWGITQAGFDLTWANNQGAAGYAGLTLHASASGSPSVALTLAGFSQADLQSGRLSIGFGTDPASGSRYMSVTDKG
jgi:V8-like Glu-specific endopeptidase